MISVAADGNGKPVLNVQSSQAFTEPLVEFLIDVRFGNAELVRDYSLLLDPARGPPALTAHAAAETATEALPLAQPAAPEIPHIALRPVSAPAGAAPQIVLATHPVADGIETQHRVVAHETLRSIVRGAGARTEAEQQRLMMAIFQANRSAFGGNINRMYSGALIKIPTAAELQAFNDSDLEREFRAQMSDWRKGARPVSRRAVARASQPPALREAPAPDPQVLAVAAAMTKLEDEVQLLQHNLDQTNRQLAMAAARVDNIERRAAQSRSTARPAAPQLKPAGHSPFNAMVWGLALLGGGLAYAWKRFLAHQRQPRDSEPAEQATIETAAADFSDRHLAIKQTEAYTVSESASEPARYAQPSRDSAVAATARKDEDATLEIGPVGASAIDPVEVRGAGREGLSDTLVLETLEPRTAPATDTELDYNLSDLDGRALHVEMPGSLHEHVVVVERRKNIVNTLRSAIQRDPTRNDLRMKLLETLYSAAATNLRAFKEVVREVSSRPERLNQAEWEQVMAMGRQIAADDALFAEPSATVKIADCA
jgi:FimV-like protein